MRRGEGQERGLTRSTQGGYGRERCFVRTMRRREMEGKSVPVGSFFCLGTETAFDVLSRAQKLMREGHDVVNLGIGQSDSAPPAHVVEACVEALRGGCMSAEDTDRLAEGLKDYPDVKILSDEIYSRLVFGGASYRSFLHYSWLKGRVIVLEGWSKSYAMTGWRVGMAVWPKDLFLYAERFAINSYSCVNAPAQWGALAALRGLQESVDCDVS